MTKRNYVLVIVSLALMGFSLTQLLFAGAPVGVPVVNGVYEISNINHLNAVAEAVNDPNNSWKSTGYTFRLKADIGTSITKFENVIGTQSSPFKGVFDGNGYRIWLNIQKGRQTGVGLFGYAEGAIIKNLTVKGNVVGNNSVAGIVGRGTSVTIEHCTNLAKITGNTYIHYGYGTIGNLLSFDNSDNSINSVVIFDPLPPIDPIPPDPFPPFPPIDPFVYSNYCGGIVGYGTGITINNAVNSGEIFSDGSAGGIMATGSDSNASISYCVNLGTVKAGSLTGGIIASGATLIQYCHNAGYVHNSKTYSGTRTGGIIAHNNKQNSVIRNCLNTGVIKGGAERGAISGNNNTSSTITNCFYDNQMATVGGINGVDYPANNKAVGRQTIDLIGYELQNYLGSHLVYWQYVHQSTSYNYPSVYNAGNTMYINGIGGRNDYECNNEHYYHISCAVLKFQNDIGENVDNVKANQFITTIHPQGGGLEWTRTGPPPDTVIIKNPYSPTNCEYQWEPRWYKGSALLKAQCGGFYKEVPIYFPNVIRKMNIQTDSYVDKFSVSEVNPNVVTSNATMDIITATEGNLNVAIYDISGSKIMDIIDEFVNEISLVTLDLNNLSNLATGSYVIVVKSGNDVAVRKFIKQ